jgi:hypothetical protein
MARPVTAPAGKWCARCGIHRTEVLSPHCPVCQDDDRKRRTP